MNDFLATYAKEIWSALAGCLAGATIGSLITFKIMSGHSARGHSRVVDQRRANAGGDIVGGDKSTFVDR